MRRLVCHIVPRLLIGALSFAAALSALAADKYSPRPTPTVVAPTLPRLVPVTFARGESLLYVATLNELPAGEARMHLRKDRQEGREVYRVTVQGQTSEWIAYLYRLHGTANGMFAANGFTPLLFRLTLQDEKRQREISLRYDPTSRALLSRVTKGKRVKERSVPAMDTYDPITAFYLLRSSDLTPGKSFKVGVFTGKERYRIVARVVRKEKVALISGVRPAIRLHLEAFSLDDAPQENLLPQDTTLWVATDETHAPLKLESFLPLGWLVVELNDH